MTALTPVLSIRLPEARVPTSSAFLAEFRQVVAGWFQPEVSRRIWRDQPVWFAGDSASSTVLYNPPKLKQ